MPGKVVNPCCSKSQALGGEAGGEGKVDPPPYDPKVYASLPSIKEAGEALKQVTEGQMIDIAKIFVKHNLYEKVGLCLLHKHFALRDDERLVEKTVAGEDGSDSKLYEFCETCEGHNVITETRPVLQKDLGVVSAHSYVITDDGKAKAYEFQEGEQTIALPEDFLFDLSGILKKNNLLGIFGVHMHHRPGKDKEGVLIEINDPDGRVNIITNVPVKESDGAPVTHVLWRFAPPEEEGMPPIIELACHCSGKCVSSEHENSVERELSVLCPAILDQKGHLTVVRKKGT